MQRPRRVVWEVHDTTGRGWRRAWSRGRKTKWDGPAKPKARAASQIAMRVRTGTYKKIVERERERERESGGEENEDGM